MHWIFKQSERYPENSDKTCQMVKICSLVLSLHLPDFLSLFHLVISSCCFIDLVILFLYFINLPSFSSSRQIGHHEHDHTISQGDKGTKKS